MLEELPQDSDGDALRGLIATGSDLSKEMEIDFMVDVPDRDTGLAFAAVVNPMGFRTSVELDNESQSWTCYCSQTNVPSYDYVVQTQKLLAKVGAPYNAKPDGWGTFGNST